LGTEAIALMFEYRMERLDALLKGDQENLSLANIIGAYAQVMNAIDKYLIFRDNRREIRLGAHFIPRLGFTDGTFPEAKAEITVLSGMTKARILKHLDMSRKI